MKYRLQFGYYSERILADKIYRSKVNRYFCKEHEIRMSGLRIGHPRKDHSAVIRQELQKIGERNVVECKIGKRKLGRSLIMANLQITAGVIIGMDIFILNMKK